MSQSLDLYVILRRYALKHESPVININNFIRFLENYAATRVQEQPEWERWANDTEARFWTTLSVLVENEKCALLADAGEDQLYMPFYCMEKLREIYQNSEIMADRPFPDEEYLKIVLPEGQFWPVNLDADMGSFFEESDTSAESPGGGVAIEVPVASHLGRLVKIIFPVPFGSALVPSLLIPHRLLEASFLKLRGYLQSHGNKVYILHKLDPYLPGREKPIRDMLDQLLLRPAECKRNLESSGDFSTLFWSYFCSLVKTDIEKKEDLLAEDLAAIQAAFIIEACNSFYKEREAFKKEKELALRNLDQRMDQPPFYYTLDEIIRFSNDKGISLLETYSNQDLEEHIKKRTTESKSNELPEWLIVQGRDSKRWYIKKNKYLPVCTRMLLDCRPHIRKGIIDRWVYVLKEFRKESAMEKDEDFEKLLAAHTMNFDPMLMILLEDPKLPLVYSELEHSHTNIPAASRFVKDGRLLPLSILYAFRRKDMFLDAKFLLPIWYSIPILVRIIAFFKNRGRKKQRGGQAADSANTSLEGTEQEKRAMQSTAQGLEAGLLPPGFTRDNYLSELEDRWSRVLDKQSRQALVSDVQALLRDNLRYTVKIYKTKQLSQESLGEMADTMISNTPALQRLGSRQTLRLYMQLYMIKLLINSKL
ncbi:MAG: hypothetical protein LBK62_09795 [Treponema sp.]|nr:hypothetical protein [Treponema sp.]